MTEKEKDELRQIIRETVSECNKGCSLGIRADTAHELISLADTWKSCRRYALGTLVTVAIGGILGALWLGIKSMLKQ